VAAPPAEALPLSLQTRAAEALSESQRAHAGDAPERGLLEQRARSLAEQRLFELLSADPLTRGLFELNRALQFNFGTRPAEPDLVSLPLRLVLEVDGYYHFQELDAYRRDRRKDVLLQQHGYLVSRHLASDVVERAGEVMRVIRELVTQRRKKSCTENAS
jgi:very-short-patch-repair endonuclease